MYPGIRAIMAIRDLQNPDVAGYPGIKRISIDLLYVSGYFRILNIFLSALVSPSRVRVCCAVCGASEHPEKTRPGILEHVPYGFIVFLLTFARF